MAFPYTFEECFELGTIGDFDSEADTGSLLDILHYTQLLNLKDAPMPYRGAYCARINMGDTNDHTLTEGSMDIADGGTGYVRFYLYADANVTASADDVFSIFEWQQAGGTVEGTIGMQITAATNYLEIGIGDGTAPSSYVSFPRKKWVCVEALYTCSTVGAGAFTLYLDGTAAIALTSLTNAAAIGQGVLGTQLTLSTTTGGLYFDQVVFDDARIGMIPIRYPQTVYLTKSGHVFVGAGEMLNISLLSGSASDNELIIYDTDAANSTNLSNRVAYVSNTAGGETVDLAGVPVTVQRGCFVALSGTNPRAIVTVGWAQGYWSAGRIKQHAAKRVAAPGGF